ncbi:MAG TPA: zinc ribbon domain-containing protein [Bacteroidota bacterium]|nr:zinc ribbon domain-containing protein [Bacteroidota bacterium]
MTPKASCSNCGKEVIQSDKFCNSCGALIELPFSTTEQLSDDKKLQSINTITTEITCPLCGKNNPNDSLYCESCGGTLHSARQTDVKSNTSQRSHQIRFFQSWKLTVTLAIVLIATIILFKYFRNEEPNQPHQASDKTSALIQEIESLQQTIDDNPKDQETILRLANIFYDVKFLPKAVAMYEKYIALDPSNADVRVDLGITYFELSMMDTTKTEEYLIAAKKEMEQALGYIPRHQLAHFNLGIVNLHQGDMAKANEWFTKCVAINPNSEPGKKAKQLLDQHSFNKPL